AGKFLLPVIWNAPLAELLIDDQFGGAILFRLHVERIRAGGNFGAADVERLLGDQHRRFVGAEAPNLAVLHDPAPDFARFAGLGVLGVRPAVDDRHAVLVDDGADRLVRADALLLRQQR